MAESARPAVVVSSTTYNQSGDLVLAAITTHPPRGASDVALQDWNAAGLKSASTVRMLLATIIEARIVHHVGRLSARDWAMVRAHVSDVFR